MKNKIIDFIKRCLYRLISIMMFLISVCITFITKILNLFINILNIFLSKKIKKINIINIRNILLFIENKLKFIKSENNYIEKRMNKKENKKDILVITPTLPIPAYSGEARRNYLWLKFLSKYYNVTVIGMLDPKNLDKTFDEVSFLDIVGVKDKRKYTIMSKIEKLINAIIFNESITQQNFYSKELAIKIKELTKKNKFEFVFFEGIYTSVYRDFINETRYFFDDHNVEFELFERKIPTTKKIAKILAKKESKKIKSIEKDMIINSITTFAVSQRDSQLLNNEFKVNVKVVNNSYEDMQTDEKIDLYSKPTLVFIGTLDWWPNVKGLQRFIENIFPLIKKAIKNVELKLIISKSDDNIGIEPDKQIKIHKNTLEAQKNEIIKKSWIAIAPIYHGSGTRIKILEYWSNAKPVVSSVVGAEGLNASSGTFIENTDQKFAERIIKILNDKSSMQQLGKENYNVFKKYYCEDVIYTEKLLSEIEETINK